MADRFAAILELATAHAVVMRHHAPAAAWIFIVLDDVRLGPATGGTRIQTYREPAEGLVDALRLGAGMTAKWAAIGAERGGGKAVLALSRPLSPAERTGLLELYGRIIDSLRGGFGTGPDLGASLEDMQVVAGHTDHVHGIHPDGRVEDPGPYTARGVRVSIEAALAAVTGSAALAGRRIWVEGVGDVGAPLARELAERGARILITDLDAARATAVAAETGGEALPASAAPAIECDVYAPCAVGATLSATTIPRLRCRAVAGSANNQLAEEADALRLHERGILYAPDWVANGGGALAYAHFIAGIREPETLLERVEGIGERIGAIFAEAAERRESPQAAARRQVERVLAAARPRRDSAR
jgi:leucine dehydrogenase